MSQKAFSACDKPVTFVSRASDLAALWATLSTSAEFIASLRLAALSPTAVENEDNESHLSAQVLNSSSRH